MRIAIASGKGGTGKTTVAVSLALSLAGDDPTGGSSPCPPLLLDCDVEAPDAHVFLHPTLERTAKASLLVPVVNDDRCTACGRCGDVCAFNALAVLGKGVLVLPELCHGCGSCSLVCPEDAIGETPRVIGRLEEGSAGKVRFARGVLNVGEAMPVPVIRQLKAWVVPEPGQITIVDAPPGTSCPVVEAIRDSDFVLLVTEPTPFGLHDLELAVDVVSELGLPAGIVINRDGIGDGELEAFCQARKLPILLRIPLERTIAEGIARGNTLLDVRPEYGDMLRDLANRISGATLVQEV
jgi:MinD superfamily P-loop ATPase